MNPKEAENISAISAVFHQDKRYQDFYDSHKDTMGGFVGLWCLCATMGLVFTKAEAGVDWDGDWIDAVDTFVDLIYTNPSDISEETLLIHAKQAITKAVNGQS